MENCFPKQKVKITYKNRCEWIDQNLKKWYSQERDFSEILLFRNREKLNENFTELNLIYIKQISESHGKLLKLSLENQTESQIYRMNFSLMTKLCQTKLFTNAFNNYFLNVGKPFSKIIVSTGDPLSYVNSNLITIFVPSIQEIEILNVLSLLNNSTAGYNDLQLAIMKMLTKVYIKPLTYFINISIKQGIFSEELKLAKVIPIYKSDDNQLIQNYKPISLISYFSKVFEKNMYNHVIDILEHNNILYDF